MLETCYAGNISSSACQGLLQEAWQIQNEYAKEAARTIRYSDVYREDSNNLYNILLGLDKDSVSYWKDIEAISKVSGRPLLEVKKEYSWALIADSVSKSLAASMGYNANAGKGTSANNIASSSLKLGETKIINDVSYTRVGRWMSTEELAQMQSTGKVVQGGGGQTFISINGVNDFKGAAPRGSVYVEFDVPTNSLIQGGNEGWYKMLGPNASGSQKYLLEKQGGSLTPNISNINVIDTK